VGEELERLAAMPGWLGVLDDDARIEAALRAVVPELRGAKLRDVRLKNGAWTARCRLDLPGQDGAERSLHFSARIIPPGGDEPAATPPTVAPGSPERGGWIPALRLTLVADAEPEGKLPALALLTDPERARAFLEQVIRAGTPAYHDLRILGCEPRVMRYSAGSRCTILYKLQLPAEERAASWPDVVVVKTYHRPDKGRIAWEGMQGLWQSPLRTSRVVTIAEPLAWEPELLVLVQGPIRQERTLKDLLLETFGGGGQAGWEELGGFLAKTAAGLAELHQSGVQSAQRRGFADELAEVREVLGRVTAQLPDLAGAADPFLDQVERLAERVPADPPGPAHRSFRPAQVLLHGGEIGFIDFDGFCHAEPALDVALFRATARDLAMSTVQPAAAPETSRAVLARVDELCEEFLASYQALAPVSAERVAVWEALDLLTNVLHAWTKAKPNRLTHGVAILRDHAGRLEALTAS
jgi:Ser/Thr protein kinase RdoA (MazF antagonist)